MRTKETTGTNYVPSVAIIATTTSRGKQTYSIEYDTLEELSTSIFELTSSAGSRLDETTVALPTGETYRWNETGAHYCFAHGRITTALFVEHQFSEESAL